MKLKRHKRFAFLITISVLFIFSLILLSSKAPKQSINIHTQTQTVFQPLKKVLFDSQKLNFKDEKEIPILDDPVWFLQVRMFSYFI